MTSFSTEAAARGDIEVSSAAAGSRLDHFLTDHFPLCSRTNISAAVRSGRVRVDGTRRKNSYRLKPGEIVVFDGLVPESPAEAAPEPEAVDFPILFEDDSLLFLSKPPGLVVHPGSGNPRGTLVNALLSYCEAIGDVGERSRPGIVHRLDKDTSGVMVVAKTAETHRLLSAMFKEHRLRKFYTAIVCGLPTASSGRITAAIGRHPVHRQKMALTARGGRYAATSWRLVEPLGRYALVDVEIETGRTHQIRVHLAGHHHPLAGDTLYGGSRGRQRPEIFPRQMLHARTLELVHPISGENLRVTAPLWADFGRALDQLRKETA